MHLSEEDFFGNYFDGYPIEATEQNLDKVRSFCLSMWKERHSQSGGSDDELPEDLSNACKFTALFGSVVFGADIGGNYDHVYNVLDGRIIDINAGAADVMALSDPYRHDDQFIGSRDFQDSMESCVRRVEMWISAFQPAGMPSP
ncbi:hypothetical protein G6L37_34615 [Agrobacterium rubi]|nr:hypothetical protein [Agrobacterium rubi]NTF23701.1 hypothetical protein [Agrobacterium rubi]